MFECLLTMKIRKKGEDMLECLMAMNLLAGYFEYCSNLFGKIRKGANFDNAIVEILRKSRREEREMM